MAVHRVNPLAPQDTPDLGPLRNSHEANQIEVELKALFIAMFGEVIRPAERAVNTLGAPHIGPFDQVERAVKAEGLALFRRDDESAMRYLFRSWRARNPKRGLHMLKAYVQVLWPNGWIVDQLWQAKAGTYPTDLSGKSPTRYMTSRVRVSIESEDKTGQDVLAALPALRSVVPARILLTFTMLTRTETALGITCGMYAGFNFQQFEGPAL